MPTKGNITKKKSNFLNGLKGLTNWLFSNNRRREELEWLIEKYEFDNNIIKRFLLYTYNTPHV